MAIIIFGCAVLLYLQNRRIDDLKEGLYKYLGARFDSIDQRFGRVEEDVRDLKGRVGRIEEDVRGIKNSIRELEKAAKIIQ